MRGGPPAPGPAGPGGGRALRLSSGSTLRDGPAAQHRLLLLLGREGGEGSEREVEVEEEEQEEEEEERCSGWWGWLRAGRSRRRSSMRTRRSAKLR